MSIKVPGEPLHVRLSYLIGKRCTRDKDGAHFIVTGVTYDSITNIMFRAYKPGTGAVDRGFRLPHEDFLTSFTRYRDDY